MQATDLDATQYCIKTVFPFAGTDFFHVSHFLDTGPCQTLRRSCLRREITRVVLAESRVKYQRLAAVGLICFTYPLFKSFVRTPIAAASASSTLDLVLVLVTDSCNSRAHQGDCQDR